MAVKRKSGNRKPKRASAEESTGASDATSSSPDIEGSSNTTGEAAAASDDDDSKTAFILQFGPEVKPRAIVQKAAEIGMKIKADYASNVRSKAKKEGRWPATGAPVNPANGKATYGNAEVEFMTLLNSLGLDRAENLVALYRAAHGGRKFSRAKQK